MSPWRRRRTSAVCGSCGARIPAGTPLLERTLAQLVRCAGCAGEPVPQDVPETVAPSRRPVPFTRVAALAARFTTDYAKAAANDRDPGEDD